MQLVKASNQQVKKYSGHINLTSNILLQPFLEEFSLLNKRQDELPLLELQHNLTQTTDYYLGKREREILRIWDKYLKRTKNNNRIE